MEVNPITPAGRPFELNCSTLLPGMANLRRAIFIYSLVLSPTAFTACGDHGNNGCIPVEHHRAATTRGLAVSGDNVPVLLFDGTGTSPCDVVAIETILENNQINYSTTSSSQLNEISELQIRKYRLLIVPGGNFIDMGNSLTSHTAANIRNAVHNGLNYFGICAGGLLAGNSSYYNGFNLTSNVRFSFYSGESRGITKAAVLITVAGGSTLDQYWEDGPQFTGWGSVIGKYPDGTPAIVEGTFGSGWIILSGIHAEAPEDWRRRLNFTSPASADNAYAATLIRAALNRVSLLHF
jgi:glutamine amidotransferase-like uncharacterized protein